MKQALDILREDGWRELQGGKHVTSVYLRPDIEDFVDEIHMQQLMSGVASKILKPFSPPVGFGSESVVMKAKPAETALKVYRRDFKYNSPDRMVDPEETTRSFAASAAFEILHRDSEMHSDTYTTPNYLAHVELDDPQRTRALIGRRTVGYTLMSLLPGVKAAWSPRSEDIVYDASNYVAQVQRAAGVMIATTRDIGPDNVIVSQNSIGIIDLEPIH